IFVAEEFEDISMECIRSRPNHLIYDAARGSAIFGAVIVGKDLELLHRIWVRVKNKVVAEKVVVVYAVNQKRQRLGALSAYVERVSRAVVRIVREDAGLQQPQLKGIAFDQRQIYDAALRLHRAEGGSDRIHLR